MELITSSYSGMLDQGEFKEWHKFLSFRIMYRYTPEEVSFLMGKPPYYYVDYEIISSGFKLSMDDQALLGLIFRAENPRALVLDDDGFGIFVDRVVRVIRVEEQKTIHYTMITPWPVKANKELLCLRETKRSASKTAMVEVRSQVEQLLGNLFVMGFFRCKRTPLEIYREVEEGVGFSMCLRPEVLKQAIYSMMSVGKLTLRTANNQFYFQEWSAVSPLYL